MIRIFIADDHAMVRGGLKQIIATGADMRVTGEATDGPSTLAQLQLVTCDLLLLDLTMPGSSGVELIQRVRQEHPTLPILILSMHNEGQIVARALKAGASGYVTKGSEPEVLLAAIHKIANGGRFVDPSLMDAMVVVATSDGRLPHESLSERELQILKLISTGAPLGKIADQLHLSPKTVSTYKMRLMEKLAIDNNADLIRYATWHSLISGPSNP
jgi:DNA-binding NarL/FixJ family response regulator